MRTESVTEVPIAIGHVWEYVADFRNTRWWEPATVLTARVSGHGGVGTVYRSVSTLAGRPVELDHLVTCYRPLAELGLLGRCDLLVVEESFEVERCDLGTRVRHVVDVEPLGPPHLLGAALGGVTAGRRAEEAARLLTSCLRELPRTGRGPSW